MSFRPSVDARALAAFVSRAIVGLTFFMAGWWKVFTVGALTHAQSGFVEPYADTWLPAWALWATGTAVPFVELVGGGLTLVGWLRWPAALGLGGVAGPRDFRTPAGRTALRLQRTRAAENNPAGGGPGALPRRPLERGQLAGEPPVADGATAGNAGLQTGTRGAPRRARRNVIRSHDAYGLERRL